MRAVVQRVKNASVSAGGITVSSINNGIIAYLGVHKDDTDKECEYMADKIVNLRIFEDSAGKMNLSVLDISGEILVISQFTLYGDTRKGRRPSYNYAADPVKGNNLYIKTAEIISSKGISIKTGIFGENMQVEYINDGPVTVIIDSAKVF